MEEEQRAGKNVGLTGWIVEGIEIQQQQLRILDEMACHTNPTQPQQMKVAKLKESLIQRFANFMTQAEPLFPDLDFAELEWRPSPWVKGNPVLNVVNRHVPLPSQLESSVIPVAYQAARETELVLRMGEANDALQGIRTEIGYKSYVYRAQIRPYKGKNGRTRGWDNIKRSEGELRFYRKVYQNALAAMKRLGASADVLAQYKEITKEDLRAVTSVSEPNARGQSKEKMAWFWSLDVAGDSDNSEYLEECKSHPIIFVAG